MEMQTFWLFLFATGVVSAAEVESSDLVEIEINGVIQKYPMTPSADSPAVEMVKEHLLGQLDLESFVKDLGRLENFIRVAYNGIGAAGPRLYKVFA